MYSPGAALPDFPHIAHGSRGEGRVPWGRNSLGPPDCCVLTDRPGERRVSLVELQYLFPPFFPFTPSLVPRGLTGQEVGHIPTCRPCRRPLRPCRRHGLTWLPLVHQCSYPVLLFVTSCTRDHLMILWDQRRHQHRHRHRPQLPLGNRKKKKGQDQGKLHRC